MSVIDVIDDFDPITCTVTRVTTASPPYDAHGRKLAGTPSTFTITASVQPLSGRDLMMLPEAARSEETRWLYTATELRTLTPSNAADSVVGIDGSTEPWIVKTAEKWDFDGQTHWRCRIARRVAP